MVAGSNPKFGTRWLLCPQCGDGSVITNNGVLWPPSLPGDFVGHLPDDVAGAWSEARTAHAVGSYTAAEIMCRKILMHVAVDACGSDPGKSFVQYVNELDSGGYIPKGLTEVVDKVRLRGNVANHDLPASSEPDSRLTMTITEHLLRGIYELPNLI